MNELSIRWGKSRFLEYGVALATRMKAIAALPMAREPWLVHTCAVVLGVSPSIYKYTEWAAGCSHDVVSSPEASHSLTPKPPALVALRRICHTRPGHCSFYPLDLDDPKYLRKDRGAVPAIVKWHDSEHSKILVHGTASGSHVPTLCSNAAWLMTARLLSWH